MFGPHRIDGFHNDDDDGGDCVMLMSQTDGDEKSLLCVCVLLVRVYVEFKFFHRSQRHLS